MIIIVTSHSDSHKGQTDLPIGCSQGKCKSFPTVVIVVHFNIFIPPFSFSIGPIGHWTDGLADWIHLFHGFFFFLRHVNQ